MFYVVILKTDTPNKPFAVHLTQLTKRYEQKAVFKMFTKQFAANCKEYYVNPLVKNGKQRNFYTKSAALAMVRNLANEHGYYVKQPGNTWKPHIKKKTVRKAPVNKQYEVTPIPTEDLREFVLISVENCGSVDAAANLLFKRNIPVFSMKTRQFGVSTLFSNSIRMLNNLLEENMDQQDALSRAQWINSGDTYRVPGKYGSPPGFSSLVARADKLQDWNYGFYKKKKTVHQVCAVLTKLYSKTPGSRNHTEDAVPLKDISSVSSKVLVV